MATEAEKFLQMASGEGYTGGEAGVSGTSRFGYSSYADLFDEEGRNLNQRTYFGENIDPDSVRGAEDYEDAVRKMRERQIASDLEQEYGITGQRTIDYVTDVARTAAGGRVDEQGEIEEAGRRLGGQLMGTARQAGGRFGATAAQMAGRAAGDVQRQSAEASERVREQMQEDAERELESILLQAEQGQLVDSQRRAEAAFQRQQQREAANDAAGRGILSATGSIIGGSLGGPVGAAVGGLAGGAAYELGSMLFSDERMKTNKKDAMGAAYDFLDAAQVAQYDMPATGSRNETGVMAQSIEDTELGQQLVQEGPGGLRMIDSKGGFGALLAAQKNLHERLKQLES